jgi:hypothetical protein
MRLVTAIVLVVGLATGCAERREPIAEPQAPPAESEPGGSAPSELPGATCRTVNEGNPANFPDFIAVELGSGDGVDRITFRFQPQPEAPAKPPWHFINFTDELITEGEGRPVQVDGEAFVVVSFQAVGTDLSGEMPEPVYTGDERFTPGFATLKEAVMLGDFEGQVSWGLGLSEKACYRVDAGADHLTLEFPSA